MRIFMDRSRKSFSDCFSLGVIAFAVMCFVIMKDTGTTAALCWLAVVFSVSFFMRPFMPFYSLKFPDHAFGLRYSFGLFICFFTAWSVSATGLFEYSDPVVCTVFFVFAILGIVIKKYIYKEPYVTREEVSGYLKGFAVFAVIFLAFFWIIGFNPVVDPGTENYMDFGFMQTIYRQKSAVPFDMWFSGQKLNYYYLGQSMAVYMCRLSHTTPEYGYNMMLSTFIALVFLMVYELVAAVSTVLLPDDDRRDKCAICGGIIGGTAAAFAANTHWLLFGVILPVFGIRRGSNNGDYWFSDGTVYISSSAGDPDNGKNEFPAYSVLLGDLHAHVINLIFVLPLLALLFDLCFSRAEKERRLPGIYRLIMISALLGYYKGSNYWDFAIYYVITGAVIVFSDLKKKGATLPAFSGIALKALTVTAVSYVVMIPFMNSFVKMESGIALCEVRSPIEKLAVLWLVPAAVTVFLIILLYKDKSIPAVNTAARSGFLAFMLCTLGLVITPEIIYVKDIYGSANSRFNTMFKLTYQAFVLFAIIIGTAFAVLMFKYMTVRKRSVIAVLLILAVIVTALSAGYTPYSVHLWYGNVFDAGKRKGISSFSGLRDDGQFSFEMQAYDFLAQDPSPVINIVEAAGDSYTHDNALSVYSGACTPIGWFVHEWMWHNDPDPVRERADSVSMFYSCGSEEYCRYFLKHYDIDYIFVGPVEASRYAVDRKGFWNLGETVVLSERPDGDLALIKVDRSKL